MQRGSLSCRKGSVEIFVIRMQQLVADGIKTIGVILFIDGTMNLRVAFPLARCV